MLFDRLSVNVVTNYRLPLPEILALYARHGVRQVALWREKVDEIGLNETKQLLRRHNMKVTSMCGWLSRKLSTITVEEKIETAKIAAELGSPKIALLAPNPTVPTNDIAGDRDRAFEHAMKVVEGVRPLGLKIALEPIHPWFANSLSCLNTLEQATEWCDRLGPNVGLEMDIANIWWQPQLESLIRRAGERNLIYGFQLCDVPAVPNGERVVMGEGVVDIARLHSIAEASGYRDAYEVELIGAALWSREPEDYMNQIMQSCRRILG